MKKITDTLKGIALLLILIASAGLDGYMFMDRPLAPIVIIYMIAGIIIIVAECIEREEKNENKKISDTLNRINRNDSYRIYDIR